MNKKQLSLSTLWSTLIPTVLSSQDTAKRFYEGMLQETHLQEANREVYDLMVITLHQFLGSKAMTKIDNKYNSLRHKEEEPNEERRIEDRRLCIGTKCNGLNGIRSRRLGGLQNAGLST